MFYTEKELEKAEVRIANGRKVYSLPPKPCLKISEAVKYYLCALIPQGRLVIGDTLEKFVAKKLKIEYILFEEDLFDKAKNIDDILKYDGTYKMISNVGRVYKIYEEKLSIEGFTFKTHTKYMVKVSDYKKPFPILTFLLNYNRLKRWQKFYIFRTTEKIRINEQKKNY